jgi:triacylglycerol esterase/lipase EstA (alpha/beta hydrolase family)
VNGEVQGVEATVTGLAQRPDETRALTRLAFDELGGAVGGIGQFHRAIANRIFTAVGDGGRAAQAAHDVISRAVYAGLRSSANALASAADAALRYGGTRDERALSSTPQGSALLAVLNGLIGDVLEREQSPLHQPMAVRVDGRGMSLDADALEAAFPAATPRLVVFLHGLMETELSWHRGAAEGREGYGARLERDVGCTPVYVRYNSGLHVSDNGRALDELLAGVADAWPVEVGEIALVGHSMGGLVCRSACYQASERGERWVGLVRHVVSLGTPHMGAPLSQGVHLASAALARLPETRPLSAFLRRRSAGIRDLRQGSLVDEDWKDSDPDALRAAACKEVPLLDGATHCFVAATVTSSPRHPVARLIGDWLVLEPSAAGRSRTRRIPFEAEHGMHVGPAHHFALLNHPVVYERLHEWLAAPPAAVG